MSTDEKLPVFVPSLISVLFAKEQAIGRELTVGEVLGIKEESICITLRESTSAALDASRGYQDIDPENCWAQWQQFRSQLAEQRFAVSAQDLAPPTALQKDVTALSGILPTAGVAKQEVIDNQLLLLAEESAKFLHRHGIL